MDFMTGLAAVGKGIEIVKSLREVEVKTNEAAFRLQVAELHTALAEAKIALAEAKEQAGEQEREIKRLKDIQANKMSTVSYNSYSFGIDENGKSIGRPFCPTCERESGHQIQLVRSLGPGRSDTCPRCKSVYTDYPSKLPDEYQKG